MVEVALARKVNLCMRADLCVKKEGGVVFYCSSCSGGGGGALMTREGVEVEIG